MSWISEIAPLLPKRWAVTRISNVADVQFSNVDKHSLDDEPPARLCNYVDVYKNDRITGDLPFMEATASATEIERFQIQPGDVLVTKDSETPDDIAIPALVTESLPDVLCGYHLAMIRPRSNRVRGDFLYWLHASKEFRGQYEREAVGVTRFGLSQHSFLAASLPLPPADEQKRIAAYLDASCRAIDAAVSAKREQIAALRSSLESVIFAAVTRGLNCNARTKPSQIDWLPAVPRHWAVLHIKRRCELLRGKFSHRPRNDPALYDGPYPFIQTGDISSAGKFITAYSQTLNEDGLAVSKQFPRGTLVMSIAANIGDVAILDFEACFPDSVVGLVPNHQTDLNFLFYMMRAMKPIMLKSAILTTQLNLNYVRIGMNHAAFPPRTEQEEISTFLDSKSAEVSAAVGVIERQATALTAYRKSLIHECVTGQRRITDADVHRVTAHVTTLA